MTGEVAGLLAEQVREMQLEEVGIRIDSSTEPQPSTCGRWESIGRCCPASRTPTHAPPRWQPASPITSGRCGGRSPARLKLTHLPPCARRACVNRPLSSEGPAPAEGQRRRPPCATTQRARRGRRAQVR